MKSIALPPRVEMPSFSSTPPYVPTDYIEVNHSDEDGIVSAAKEGNVELLKEYALGGGGFRSSECRAAAWPVLLGVERRHIDGRDEIQTTGSREATVLRGEFEPSASGTVSELETIPHKDESQVKLDVNRSFVLFPSDISPDEKQTLKSKLENVIVTVLRRHPSLHYFQGYHDIVSIFLLTLVEDEVLVIECVEKMSLHRIRDSMGNGLQPVVGYLKLVQRILEKEDLQLSRTVEMAAAVPFFSLSWILTLLSHDLSSLAAISRIFDFLLSHNPAMVAYLGVAIILLKKHDIAMLDEDDAEDPALLHHTLSKLPNIQISTPAQSIQGASPSSENDMRSSSPSSISGSLVDLSDSAYMSIDALEDSMLSDPDVVGAAFLPPTPPAVRPIAPAVSVDELVNAAMRLYEKYPLVGERGIAADEIMGPKSCIFTWPLSAEGRLSDQEADEISSEGKDIVMPEPTKPSAEQRQPLTKHTRNRGKRFVGVDLSLGAVLVVVAISGVLLALYGSDLKASSARNGWWNVGSWRPLNWN